MLVLLGVLHLTCTGSLNLIQTLMILSLLLQPEFIQSHSGLFRFIHLSLPGARNLTQIWSDSVRFGSQGRSDSHNLLGSHSDSLDLIQTFSDPFRLTQVHAGVAGQNTCYLVATHFLWWGSTLVK